MQVPLNRKKEWFSDAYLRAIVARAGATITKPEDDFCRVDRILMLPDCDGPRANPVINIQLKCTASDIVDEEHVRFPLDVDSYRDLSCPTPYVPVLLVVVVVPEKIEDWILQSESELLLRGCGYYKNLQGDPPTDNTSSITVRIPRTQILTPSVLIEIFKRSAEGPTQ